MEGGVIGLQLLQDIAETLGREVDLAQNFSGQGSSQITAGVGGIVVVRPSGCR